MKSVYVIFGASGYLAGHLVTLLKGEKNAHAKDFVVTVSRTSNRHELADRHYDVSYAADDIRLLFKDLLCETGQAFEKLVIINTLTDYGRSDAHAEAEIAGRVLDANFVAPLNICLGLKSALEDLPDDCAVPETVFVNCGTSLPPSTNLYARAKSEFSFWAPKILPMVCSRFVNAQLEIFFGPDDDVSKFPTLVIEHLLRGAGVQAMSPGEQIRDFIDVEDAASALVVLSRNAHRLDATIVDVPVGRGEGISLRAYAQLCASTLNRSIELLDFGGLPYRENEIMNSVADTTVIRSIGWAPEYSLTDTIARAAKSGVDSNNRTTEIPSK